MGAIYHMDKPYTRDVITDAHLDSNSDNPVKNKAITGLIDDVIAPVENSNVASRSYLSGQGLIINNTFYRTNQAVSAGTPLTPGVGGNIYEVSDLATQIANAGSGAMRNVTWAQYQALPVVEKEDPEKYYWISDLDGVDYDNLRDIVAPTEVEGSAVAQRNVGDEFILGDLLYKAIDIINQGDPIVTSGTGQNAALAGTIVDQIKALFDGETVLKKVPETASTCAVHNTEAGVKLYWISSSTLDQPNSSFIYGFLINFSLGGTAPSYTDENGVQIAVKNNAQEIYIRRLYNGTWDTAWKQIYPAVKTKKYTFTGTAGTGQTGDLTFAAGTPGTYAKNSNIDISDIYNAGGTPISATIGWRDIPGTILPVVHLGTIGTDKKVYCYVYRASTTAQENTGNLLDVYVSYI